MKRTLFAGALLVAAGVPALAADITPPPGPPPRAPATYVPTTAPGYNWGGIYVGINGGWGFGTSAWSDPSNPAVPAATSTGNFNISGGLVGGTIGANFQASQFVFGVEADLDYAMLKGSVTTAGTGYCNLANAGATGTGTTCNTQDSYLGTVRGRIGYAFDRVLVFGTAGLAFGDVQAALSGGNFGSANYQSSTEIGWTAGAGVEVAFTDNLIGKVEYLFVDLSNGSCTAIASCGADNATGTAPPNDSVKFYTSLVRAGLSYKFNTF